MAESKGFRKFLPTQTVVASVQLSTTTPLGGDLALDSNVGSSQNAEGCMEAEVYADVTTYVGESALELWLENSDDGTNYTVKRYSLNCHPKVTAAGRYTFGNVPLGEYTKMYLVSPGAQNTAALYAKPIYHEGQ